MLLLGLGNLFGRKIPPLELGEECFKAAAVDDLEWIDHVPEGLGHLPALLVSDHCVEVNLAEGEQVRELERHHDHARDPEEEDVQAGLEERRGEETSQVCRVVGPSHDREWKETGAEPRVEHIFVLLETNLVLAAPEQRCSLCPRVCLGSTNHPTCLVRIAVPVHFLGILVELGGKVCGDAVSPPELARHTPGARVLQPLEPSLAVELGQDLQLPGTDGITRALGHARAVHEPLRHDHGLNDVSRPGAETEAHGLGVLVSQQTLRFQGLFHRDTSVVAHHPLELSTLFIDGAVGGKHGDERQVVTHATLVVIRVMGRGDLHSAGTQVHVHEHIVQDNGQFAVTEGVDDTLAVEMGVSGVLWVHGDSGVAEHSLETCGRDDDLLVQAVHLVGELGEHAKLVLLLGCMVRHGNHLPPLDFLVLDFNV
mmetsp:Transcript_12703/g.36824  ORF Transcript_12703/g.36824 Transcript_12703/m.36824 type:complete len:425 (-) Transcript_12703:1031-2305(-)